MSEAGLFNGEVTDAAPAEDADVIEENGYHWFEIGDIA